MSNDISDGVKIGLLAFSMVLVCANCLLIFNTAKRPVDQVLTQHEHSVDMADLQTINDVTSEGTITGANFFTFLSQYGNEIAGVMYNGTYYGPHKNIAGYDLKTIDDLKTCISKNGYDKTYTITKNKVVGNYTAEDIFIALGDM